MDESIKSLKLNMVEDSSW